MPIVSSYADLVTDWERLLTSVADNAAELTEVERYRADLQKHLEDFKALKARQDAARAAKQEATRLLKEMKLAGRDKAIRLRGVVKANLGPRSEQLSQYGMTPLRKRGGRSSAKPAEVPPPQTQP
jgi:hypothetical protein